MILVIAVIASILVALVRGGRLAALARVRFEHGWLALAAVILQYPLVYNQVAGLTIIEVPLSALMMVVSSALVVYVVWANRHLPGISLVGLGLLANLIVMALNGGWMPITPEALGRLGALSWVTPQGDTAKVWGAKNVMLARGETRLWWLSDIVVLGPPFPLPTAFSVGDALIAVGLFWLLQETLC